MGLISEWKSPLSKIKAYGTQYERIFNGVFFSESKKYLESIVKSKSIRNDWPYMRVDEDYWDIFLYKILRKFSLGEKFINKYINEYNFAPPEEFIEKTQQYLNNLFSSQVTDEAVHTIVLNNTFEPFNPTNSMQLFNNAKCIIVQRDPRDIYASTMMPNKGFIPAFLKSSEQWRIKQGFLMVDKVDSFINNQLSIYNSVNFKGDNDKVLRLRYEDIVLNYEETLNEIYAFLNIDKSDHKRKRVYFDPENSKHNIGLWQDMADFDAMKKITNALNDYCYH
jgi:hypothetical protein